MASYEYDELEKLYHNFENPVAVLKIGDKDFADNKCELILSNIEVELTCGFEASAASFCIYNGFSEYASKFEFEKLKPYILLGLKVQISLGYLDQTRTVFQGVITRVNFIYENQENPYVQVTAMDVKGIMMACRFAKQLKADNYADAVREIFTRTAYQKLQQNRMLDLEIDDTPDKQASRGEESAGIRPIEVLNESDYEFVVRAAKRYHYEFFAHCDTVYFRKAKKNKEVLMELSPKKGLLEFDIGYDITGLAEQAEVRGMDNGKAKVIQAKQKIKNKFSTASHAKSLLKGSEKVFTDPSLDSKAEAQSRVEFVAEQISYRYGSAECKCMGIPELVPGRYLQLAGLGEHIENYFYLQKVRHVIHSEEGYLTYFEGSACALDFKP
ncbi:MAG: hypothetical protein HFI70_12835 [Lachnospiraceae bacterium]|nr:hypothetical protein [Lachnospiraceae bacterium]